MKLYEFYRSTAAFRVRIALRLKRLSPETHEVHLRRQGGQQFGADYTAINPQQIVPTLVTDTGTALGQSLAIVEYLDELHPEPPLLPALAEDRAWVRAFALSVACDIHPLGTPRVQRYLREQAGLDEDAVQRWSAAWTSRGLAALETRLAAYPKRGRFAHGDTPTLADIALVPQVYNARLAGLDLSGVPLLQAAADNALRLEAFRLAAPDAHPDFEPPAPA